jgi:heat shock protein HslJ
MCIGLNIKKRLILILIMFMGIFSCSTSTQQETKTGDIPKVSEFDKSITGKYWKLVEIYGKKVASSEQRNREPHFILKADDKSVTGNGGCNSFRGSYELSGVNRIRFSKMASTMMACINTSDMEIESHFLKVLETADSYYVDVDRLQLLRARMAPLAMFEAVYFK